MPTTNVDLEQLIAHAIQKVGAKKENDLCHYIPGSTGGYIHHFTLRKMKNQVPEEVAQMIKAYIIDIEKPLQVTPKRRAPRGSRKKKGHVVLAGSDLEKLLHLLRTSGEKEMIKKLLPQKELKAIKKELISSIKRDQVDHNLWTAFVETVATSSL